MTGADGESIDPRKAGGSAGQWAMPVLRSSHIKQPILPPSDWVWNLRLNVYQKRNHVANLASAP